MTNNTQLVSVPRELLERWADRFSKAQMFKDSTEVRALLAAPAEDVRAVVDESVAGPNWQACWTDWLTHHAGTDPDGFERHWNGWKAALHANIKPQRPVVLPERHSMKSVMAAICAIPHFPMLTSNQCHALAEELNK